jgi:hypothetical protein
MPKPRAARQPVAGPQNLTLSEFTEKLGDKNGELLAGFLVGLENGELSLELDGAENWLDSTIDEWCETEEPNRELHLRMISAIFVWMILDEVYAEEIQAGEAAAQDPRERVVKVVKLSVEVIRTVQSIWGIVNGKKV